jgi:hypothetical protein
VVTGAIVARDDESRQEGRRELPALESGAGVERADGTGEGRTEHLALSRQAVDGAQSPEGGQVGDREDDHAHSRADEMPAQDAWRPALQAHLEMARAVGALCLEREFRQVRPQG